MLRLIGLQTQEIQCTSQVRHRQGPTNHVQEENHHERPLLRSMTPQLARGVDTLWRIMCRTRVRPFDEQSSSRHISTIRERILCSG